MKDQKIGEFTFRLFQRPSFLDGFVSILDFGDNFNKYNIDDGDGIADFNSISADWHAVGSDIELAMLLYGERRK